MYSALIVNLLATLGVLVCFKIAHYGRLMKGEQMGNTSVYPNNHY